MMPYRYQYCGMDAAATEDRTPLSDLVAEEIRVMMIRRRTTGRKLARTLGVSPSWLSYRLTGVQEIGLNDLDRIAAALGVSIRDLLPVASSERPNTTTPQYGNLTESMRIPAQRQPHPNDGGSHRPFGGGNTRTRPLVDINRLVEPNRKVDVSPDRMIPFDPSPPNV